MSFVQTKQNEFDELSAYLSEPISHAMASQNRDYYDIIVFWKIKWNEYPTLSKVGFHVYATPASSSESERDFSNIKRLVGTDHTLLADETISDRAYVGSAVKNT